ncbi:MAG: hypothetical protein Q4C55_04165 [Eubacterium sp.]|nr:hypothetical protein [Eubacterium sp.]
MEAIQKFAQLLDGREYKQEMTEAEKAQAKAAGVVVVFGCSDDRTVFHGAIEAEVATVDGGVIYLTEEGLFEECPCDCIHARRAKAKASRILVKWCKGPYVWSYETDIPHAAFEVIDNQPAENLKFCQGLVFSLEHLKD